MCDDRCKSNAVFRCKSNPKSQRYYDIFIMNYRIAYFITFSAIFARYKKSRKESLKVHAF